MLTNWWVRVFVASGFGALYILGAHFLVRAISVGTLLVALDVMVAIAGCTLVYLACTGDILAEHDHSGCAGCGFRK